MQILGIDVGGTGVKSNVVDMNTGNVLYDKLRIKTPTPATPEAIIECLKSTVLHFEWKNNKIGICFPSVIKNGLSMTASNIDKAFIGYPINQSFSDALQCDVTVVNDADAAGIAEMTYGKGKGEQGLVICITLGTGIGSAIFFNGQLLTNTELGHLKYKKSVFEKYASNSARMIKELSWKAWAKELDVYLNHLSLLLNPDLIILGGGVSKEYSNYGKYLNVPTRIEPAALQNNAGLIGAAMAAYGHDLAK